MGAVTYPHAEVAEFVTQRFVPIKFNVTEHHPDFKEALGRGKVLWNSWPSCDSCSAWRR